MTIRVATKDDIKNISDFSIKTYIDAFGHTFTPEELEKRLETRSVEFHEKIFEKDSILLAEEDEKLIGYIQFGDPSFPPEEVEFDLDIEIGKGDQELQRIYVLKEYQGKGIGKKLIDAAMDTERMKNAKQIFLDVWEKNLGAQKLYTTLGFEVVGKWDDGDLIMRKRNS